MQIKNKIENKLHQLHTGRIAEVTRIPIKLFQLIN